MKVVSVTVRGRIVPPPRAVCVLLGTYEAVTLEEMVMRTSEGEKQ